MPHGKCHIFLKNLHGLEHKEKSRRKATGKKIKGKCKHCKKSIDPSYQSKKVEDSFYCYKWHHEFQPFFLANVSIYLMYLEIIRNSMTLEGIE